MKFKTIDYSKFSSIKIGAKKQTLIIDKISNIDKSYFLIGSASNTLVTNSLQKLAILSKKFDYIRQDKDELIVGGATPSGKIYSYCKKHNIGGFEYLKKIPGTMGGMIKMNAGIKKHEIFNNLLGIITQNGMFLKNNIVYGYRFANIYDIIYEARFKIVSKYDVTLDNNLDILRSNQPPQPSLGSVFKNPPNDYAGRLIQEVGLKGYKIGNVGWSDIHANFIVNYGNGKTDEMLKLIDMAYKMVLKKFNIQLEKEIVII